MSHLNPLSACRASGFTLVEVLVVLTISAILLAVGVPMYNSSMASARASDAANTFLSAVELARSESIRRGLNASACRVLNPTVNPPVCGTAAVNIAGVGNFDVGDWAAGWAVFAESDAGGADGVIDPLDIIVMIQDRFAAGSAAQHAEILGAGAIGVITFGPNGLRVGGGNFTVRYPQVAAGAAVSTRTVTITALGQVAVRRP